MKEKQLVKIEVLQEILDRMISVFHEYELNDVEIGFVIDELKKLSGRFEQIKDRAIQRAMKTN